MNNRNDEALELLEDLRDCKEFENKFGRGECVGGAEAGEGACLGNQLRGEHGPRCLAGGR